MGIISYINRKLQKKKARRVTQEYGFRIDTFDLPQQGVIEFANWTNPLVQPVRLHQEMVDFFKQFIRKGDLVIDIGTNVGDTTVPMALAAGKEGLTLGFDPNPMVFRILEKNASLNPSKTRIMPHRFAITTNEEEFFYISSEASFANGGISPTRVSPHGKYVYPEKIKGVNLFQFLQSNYPDRIDQLRFIKVDTEGYDKEILKSISPLLEKYHPVVVAESFGNSSKADKAELFDVLASLGYTVSYFEDFDVRAKTQKINSGTEMGNWKKTINILATKH